MFSLLLLASIPTTTLSQLPTAEQSSPIPQPQAQSLDSTSGSASELLAPETPSFDFSSPPSPVPGTGSPTAPSPPTASPSTSANTYSSPFPSLDPASSEDTEIPNPAISEGDNNRFQETVESSGNTFQPQFPSVGERSGTAGTNPADTLPENGVQVFADYQNFDTATQIFRAEGNAVVYFGQTVLQADVVTVNLMTQLATADGNVVIDIDERQQIRGTYLEYHIDTETGTLFEAEGDLDLVTLPASIQRATLPTDVAQTSVFDPPSSPRLKFVRFQADQVNLTPEDWQAFNVRTTNDREGPPRGPELEIRSRTGTLQERPDGTSLLTLRSNRLWFDGVFGVPLRDRQILLGADEARRRPPADVLFNEDDGGLIVRRSFEVLSRENISFTVAPRVRLQQFGNEDGVLAAFGVDAGFNAVTSAGITDLFVALNTFALDRADDVGDEVRGFIRHTIPLGTDSDRGDFILRYAYRPRFTPVFGNDEDEPSVQHELGAVYRTPVVTLGATQINFSGSGAAEWFDAREQRGRDFIELGRARFEVALSRTFPLWERVLDPEAPQPRFSFAPIRQGIWFSTGVSGRYSVYTDGSDQRLTVGSVALQAVFGDFDRNFFDYSALTVAYSNVFYLEDFSPFNFDSVDTREVLTLGAVQQLYGPFRLGAESRLDLLDDLEPLSTTFSLLYDRRTYGVELNYSPTRQTGSFAIRIDDFNWIDFNAAEFTEGRFR